jgi:membrane-bound metal-dependent hydrolase YbcI (DUF457 family)
MPSPVGLALAGIAVALAGDRGRAPIDLRRFLTRPLTLGCVALAVVPDVDLLVPRFHRTATHSATATLVVTIVAVAVTGRIRRKGSATADGPVGRIAWSVVSMCAAAHASHILLDWLGRDPSQPAGVQALWPFSGRWFISGLDLFPQEERRHIFTAASMVLNLNALRWELLLMGPVVAALWWLRQRPRQSTAVAAPIK